MKHPITAIAAAAILSACTGSHINEYRPVTDPQAKNAARYATDLGHCRGIAAHAEAAYKSQQQQAMGANMAGGIIVGALLGAAIGGNSNWAAYGAGVGAAQGIAATDTELATGGPRRVVDRCMTARGHVVLNDPGKGYHRVIY